MYEDLLLHIHCDIHISNEIQRGGSAPARALESPFCCAMHGRTRKGLDHAICTQLDILA